MNVNLSTIITLLSAVGSILVGIGAFVGLLGVLTTLAGTFIILPYRIGQMEKRLDVGEARFVQNEKDINGHQVVLTEIKTVLSGLAANYNDLKNPIEMRLAAAERKRTNGQH